MTAVHQISYYYGADACNECRRQVRLTRLGRIGKHYPGSPMYQSKGREICPGSYHGPYVLTVPSR